MSLSAQEIGRIGEQLARTHLEATGYQIVAANYRCRWGEIDLVARDGPAWVFVEVRTRRSGEFGEVEESITPAKAQRLTLTGQDYISTHLPDDPEPDWRIDLLAIRLGAGRRVESVRHLENVVEG